MDSANRIRIVQAARELFEARGYRSVTMQDLADRLGISKKTIYQYFAGKDELANAVADETIARIEQALDKALSRRDESEPLAGMKQFLMFVKDESVRFGPLFLADMEKYLPDAAERYRALRARGKQSMTRLLEEAQERGVIRGDVPVPLAVEVLSVCMRALTAAPSRFAGDAALELFWDICGRGIAGTLK